MKTNRQLDDHMAGVRQAYKRGELSQRQIEAYESIPGWFWEIDLKQECIDEVIAILERAKERGWLPKNGSKDQQEHRDAQKIAQLKKAKQGKGHSTFYPELEAIAKKRGYPNLFDVIDLKQKCLDEVIEILDRADKRGRLPKESEDKQERRDAQKIGYLKQAKNGNSDGTFHLELEVIAKKRGYPNLFDVIDLKQKCLDEVIEILDRADERGRLPKNGSKDKQERRDANKINNLKQAKQGKGNGGIFYPEVEKIAKKRGYSNLFVDLKQKCINEVIAILERAKERGCLPKYKSKDEQERRDAEKIGCLKKAKQGKSNSVFYPELEVIAKKHGCPDLFKVRK